MLEILTQSLLRHAIRYDWFFKIFDVNFPLHVMLTMLFCIHIRAGVSLVSIDSQISCCHIFNNIVNILILNAIKNWRILEKKKLNFHLQFNHYIFHYLYLIYQNNLTIIDNSYCVIFLYISSFICKIHVYFWK